MARRQAGDADYYLMDLDIANRLMHITRYGKSEAREAASRLGELELQYRGRRDRDVLLASVSSVRELSRMYPQLSCRHQGVCCRTRASTSLKIKGNLTPLIPLSLIKERGRMKKREASPLSLTLSLPGREKGRGFVAPCSVTCQCPVLGKLGKNYR